MFQFKGLRRLEDLEVTKNRVLLRADLNCPLAPDGSVADDTKLLAAVPTLKQLLDAEAQVLIAAHQNPLSADQKAPSLAAAAERLAELTGVEILLPERNSRLLINRLLVDAAGGRIVLLENLLTEPGELTGDDGLARRLVEGAHFYIGDCLEAPTSGASTTRAPKFCSERAMGIALEQELLWLQEFESVPAAQRAFVLGGPFDEVEGPLRRLMRQGHTVCVGGDAGLLLAQTEAGTCDGPEAARARTLLASARDAGIQLLLPSSGKRGTRLFSAEALATLNDKLSRAAMVLVGGELDSAGSTATLCQLLCDSTRVVLALPNPRARGLVPQPAPSGLAFVSAAGTELLRLFCGYNSPVVETLRMPS